MLLSARFLTDVASINSWEYADVIEFTEGDSITFYFQLIDLNKDKNIDGFVPAGKRYISASGAVLQCTIENLDDEKIITRNATLAFPSDDRSIWKITILTSDKIRGTANLRLKLTEGTTISSGLVKNGLRIHSLTCI